MDPLLLLFTSPAGLFSPLTGFLGRFSFSHSFPGLAPAQRPASLFPFPRERGLSFSWASGPFLSTANHARSWAFKTATQLASAVAGLLPLLLFSTDARARGSSVFFFLPPKLARQWAARLAGWRPIDDGARSEKHLCALTHPRAVTAPREVAGATPSTAAGGGTYGRSRLRTTTAQPTPTTTTTPS